MTADQCVLFLKSLRAKQIKIKTNGWVECACPLAQWTHKSGIDHHPSFGLTIKPGERSHFSCFACRSGSAEELIQVLEMYSQGVGDYDFDTCRKLLNEELIVLPLPDYDEHPPAEDQFQEWPAYWLDSFQGAEWVDAPRNYLQNRGVSATTIKDFQLKWDSQRQMVLCPYWDVFGRFAGARGRTVLPDKTGAAKHFDYSFQGRKNSKFCWYNELSLNEPGPVVVVEGQFDCWRVAESYKKVVAALTAKPSWEKMKKLADSDLLIHIPDNPKVDAAGAESIEVFKKFCNQLQIRYTTIHLDGDVKDPAECHPDYLRDRIVEVL